MLQCSQRNTLTTINSEQKNLKTDCEVLMQNERKRSKNSSHCGQIRVATKPKPENSCIMPGVPEHFQKNSRLLKMCIRDRCCASVHNQKNFSNFCAHVCIDTSHPVFRHFCSDPQVIAVSVFRRERCNIFKTLRPRKFPTVKGSSFSLPSLFAHLSLIHI